MSNNTHDLISRKALIEAIESITWYSVTNGSLHEDEYEEEEEE